MTASTSRSDKEELEQVKAIVMELMPSAMTLAVPLSVELKTGDTWDDMEFSA